MAFEAQVLTVLIASPGDTQVARDVVENTAKAWNRDRARTRRVVLLPLRWETDAIPEIGADGQAVINRQLVDLADIVIGLFHSRLGRPTPRGVSGTAEEIQRSHELGTRVHVYFSEMPLPHDVDEEELKRLRTFKEELEEVGLVGTYASFEDLAAKVRTALERDVEELVGQAANSNEAVSSHAILRATYSRDREPTTDSRGRMRMRTRRERIEVENISETVAAENVTVDVEPIGEGAGPSVFLDSPIERVAPQASVSVPVATHAAVASQWRIRFKWSESEEELEDTVVVTPF